MIKRKTLNIILDRRKIFYKLKKNHHTFTIYNYALSRKCTKRPYRVLFTLPFQAIVTIVTHKTFKTFKTTCFLSISCVVLLFRVELRANTYRCTTRMVYVKIVFFFIHSQQLFPRKTFLHSNPFLKSLLWVRREKKKQYSDCLFWWWSTTSKAFVKSLFKNS